MKNLRELIQSGQNALDKLKLNTIGLFLHVDKIYFVLSIDNDMLFCINITPLGAIQ